MARLTVASDTGAGGLGMPVARWALLFTWAVSTAQAVLGGQVAGASGSFAFGVAVLLEFCGVVLVTERSAAILSRRAAVATAAAAVVAAVLRLGVDGPIEPWTVDLPAYLAAALIARGNIAAGAVAGALVLAAVGAATAVRGGTVGDAAANLALPVIALCLCVLWRVGLGFVVRAERAHRSAEARAAVAAEASARAADEYAAQLHRIRDEASALLRRIADGPALSEAELVEVRVLEGAIRDELRSPRVRSETLATAIADARRRGVRVSMLWLEGPGEAPHPHLLEAIAALVSDVPEGAVTIRAADEAGAVTVVRSDGEGGGSRTLLDAAGVVQGVH
ncbi:hypothetical protein ACTU3I_13335 [Microbacterium sp. RD1]|uniref:hypothetical protein n=1 Tax=Microbacterium sp. RD1 TaxID=3457313 RepID=UPI003FA5599B